MIFNGTAILTQEDYTDKDKSKYYNKLHKAN